MTLEDGDPLPGVRVTLSETSVSTHTDRDGRYWLRKVAAGTYTLTLGWLDETITRSDVSVGSQGERQTRSKRVYDTFLP